MTFDICGFQKGGIKFASKSNLAAKRRETEISTLR
jgi:hypothetical protein